MSNKNGVPTESYKGVRDFYPEQQFVQNYITDTMSMVAESFGYTEYSASVLEPSELYRGKTSDEIVNEQTYNFKDRGEREVTLRPEMTPTVARMLAAKRRELMLPLRWYSIPNVFRYERPQKGRLREHWQLNADIFGVGGLDGEVEIIALASEIMRAFGAEDSDFEIRVSDRGLLESVFDELNLKDGERAGVMRLLDRKDKIDDFSKKLEGLIGDKAAKLSELLGRASSSKNLEELVRRLEGLGVTNVVINTAIVRGFDYYTGIVFEVYDTGGENTRSLFGGGRYDNLLSIFDEEPLSAVGFGMGDVTMKDFLETYNLMPEYESNTDLYLCTLDKDVVDFSTRLARELRSVGLNVEVDASSKKVGDQVKLASKKSIPYVICIGEEEIKSEKFKLKNLETGEEKEVSKGDIASAIWS
ncbi:MAG: histidine--tRNA ligase [Candidatus Pacebacteria bacterium]|jgi:histidyl-tRNA synthetase|nr:histidine--tRNA ligase [bacterium]MDP6527445.1 histidine--tRNA ligase [Candidatus Paceibacterota bacterium]MDP6659649.1 histidine--tRNA ligase [Candidatus Paceibacterota bacterium]